MFTYCQIQSEQFYVDVCFQKKFWIKICVKIMGKSFKIIHSRNDSRAETSCIVFVHVPGIFMLNYSNNQMDQMTKIEKKLIIF